MNESVPFRASYDAILVGARCAGAATAMLLARQGLRVLAVEQARYGSDTLSTLALMRGAVLALDRWGVLPSIEAIGTPAIRSTSFHYGDEAIDIKIKPRNGIGALYAPRRKYLDRLLVDAARESGAQIEHGVRLIDLMHRTTAVSKASWSPPRRRHRLSRREIVIGADGVRSPVARLVGARPYRVAKNSSAVVYGFFTGLDQRAFHWHYRPGVGAGLIPTNDGLTLVFAAMTEARFQNEIRFDREAGFRSVISECAPELAQPLSAARRVGPFHGFLGSVGYLRQSYGPGWALVGDAGYFSTPSPRTDHRRAPRRRAPIARRRSGTESALAEYQDTRDKLSMGSDITDEIRGYG
jgi:2-polyprenyl-6-methoxyphenol hydroxylase-like FAD-dependent oxidoreductase